MKKILNLTLVLFVSILVLVSGCGGLVTGFDTDLNLTLGVMNGASSGRKLVGQVSDTLVIPVKIGEAFNRNVSGSYNVAFTLDTDADLSTTGDNIAMGTISVAAGSEQNVSVTIPATAVTGTTYNLYASLDAGTGDNPGNNVVVIPLDVTAIAAPDVTVYYVNQLQKAPASGALAVNYYIKNSGSKMIPAGTAFKVAATMSLSGSDKVLGSETLTLSADLYPLATVASGFQAIMPTVAELAADAGIATTALANLGMSMALTVDPDNVFSESNETNNIATKTITTGVWKPNLTVYSIEVDSTYVKMTDPAKVKVKLRNSGYAPAAGYSLRLYLDLNSDSTYTAGTDTLVGAVSSTEAQNIPFSSTGGSNYLSYYFDDVNYPTVADAQYPLRAEVYGDMDEAVLNDNANSITLNLLSKSLDLQMVSFTGGATNFIESSAGGSIPIQYKIKNNGSDALTDSFTLAVYASIDNDLSPASDISLGTLTITSDIAAGGTLSGSTTRTFPASKPVGFYSVYWVLDGANTISENSPAAEANNTITTANGNTGVFALVRDASSVIPAGCVVYFPKNGYSNIYGSYLNVYFVTQGNPNGSGYTSTMSNNYNAYEVPVPGQKLAFMQNSLTTYYNPAGYLGLYVYGYDNIDYCFRFVPNYINLMPDFDIPYSIGGGSGVEDSFEPNNSSNSQTTPVATESALFKWTVGYLNSNSLLEYDYFYYDY